MVQSLLANTQNALGALGSIGIGGGTVGGRSPSTTTSSGSVGGRVGSGGGTRSRAEGGTILASKATNVTFGESGAEAAFFLPLNKIGRNSGRIDLSGNVGGNGMDGKIVVRLDLSPDLEARVMENSMNGVASVITQINRSKV